MISCMDFVLKFFQLQDFVLKHSYMEIEEELGESGVMLQGEGINSNTMVIDHNHPLYLSSSDVPGALSIGIRLTRMENYTLWSRAMEIALLGRNKIGFIDGSVQQMDSERKFEENLGSM